MKRILFVMAAAMVGLTASAQTPALRDYVDEYGINHGKGVLIGESVWAPVNCGYHAKMYPYGKLYQWGRKTGQGYGYPNSKDKPNENAEFADVNGKKVVFIEEPPESVAAGQSKANEHIFYYSQCNTNPFNWIRNRAVSWNVGNWYDPAKSKRDDPCPEGWRVPMTDEARWMMKYHSEFVERDEMGRGGMWFYNTPNYTPGTPRIFLPAAGEREWHDGESQGRNYLGIYWTSDWNGTFVVSEDGNAGIGPAKYAAYGFAVRCVQEDY